MHHRRSLRLAVLLFLSTTVAQAQPPAPPTADALFQSGRAAMSSGDFAGACARFAESYRLEPAPGTMLNLSLCEEKQGKLVAAQADLTEAIQKLPKGDFRSAFAEKQLEALKKRIASVTVTLEEPNAGARVACDGVELRPDALGRAIPLDPGTHVFVVQAEGRASSRREVLLAEGQQATLTLGPGPAAEKSAPSSLRAPAAARAEPGSTRRTLGVGALAIGGAGLLTGVVTGIMTASAASTYKEHCFERICDAEGADAASRGKTLEVVSPIAFVVGALGAGAGTYLLLTSKRAPSAQLTVTPTVSARDAGLAVGGSF
jgi:hypothetical protein